ncbi:hypothetical protein AgCh_004932 [Apium graveolens]
MAKGKMKRMAVLAGCNYPNTPNELHGCINDVLTMQNTLITRFRFDPTDIDLLTDAPDSTVLPTDLDFRELVNRLPEGASFTIISDSCHSGGLIDKEKEQIGPDIVPEKRTLHVAHKPKTLPFETILQQLSTLTNINTWDIGTHFLESFGGNASLKSLSPKEEQESMHPDAGILLSGYQSNETSADISSSGGGQKKAYGAFSNAIQMVLKENLGALSNKEIVILARNVLLGQLIIGQHPCLYCSDENVKMLQKPSCVSLRKAAQMQYELHVLKYLPCQVGDFALIGIDSLAPVSTLFFLDV